MKQRKRKDAHLGEDRERGDCEEGGEETADAVALRDTISIPWISLKIYSAHQDSALNSGVKLGPVDLQARNFRRGRDITYEIPFSSGPKVRGK